MATKCRGWADAQGGAIALYTAQPATITQSVFRGNSAIVTAAWGTAYAQAGTPAVFGPLAVTDSTFTENCARATVTLGTAIVPGGSLVKDGGLTLRNTTVNGNVWAASGSNGSARGSGIWNGDLGREPPELTLLDSSDIHISLSGSNAVTVQGAKLFTSATVTLADSVIAGNSPDQCLGF